MIVQGEHQKNMYRVLLITMKGGKFNAATPALLEKRHLNGYCILAK